LPSFPTRRSSDLGCRVDQVLDRHPAAIGVVERGRDRDQLPQQVENPDRYDYRLTVFKQLFPEYEGDGGAGIERIRIILLERESALPDARRRTASSVLSVKRYGKRTEREEEDEPDAHNASHHHLRTVTAVL